MIKAAGIAWGYEEMPVLTRSRSAKMQTCTGAMPPPNLRPPEGKLGGRLVPVRDIATSSVAAIASPSFPREGGEAAAASGAFGKAFGPRCGAFA